MIDTSNHSIVSLTYPNQMNEFFHANSSTA